MSPSDHPEQRVDAPFLRAWPLPEPGRSKRSRGEIVVIGGAARSPGAAIIAGRAALRAGAGRLTIAIGESSAAAAAIAFPEAGVISLAETRSGSIRGRRVDAVSSDLATADAVLIGPGLDDISETKLALNRLRRTASQQSTVVLDAFALGALSGRPHLRISASHILTPNADEAERLLGRPLSDLSADIVRIARRYRAVVTCHGRIADWHGRRFRVEEAGAGLGTSGSGDALAGAIAGLAARGCDPLQAAVWGTYVHIAAGCSLAREIASIGFLATEVVDRLPFEFEAVNDPEGTNRS